LGDFRLLREVGRGGMGVVYEAVQISLNRRVALKVLPLAATLDPRQLQRFRHEAQAAAMLHHPNIVPVHGVGCERGVHYYAMQLIEGRSLAAVIAELRGDPVASRERQRPEEATTAHAPVADAPGPPAAPTAPVAARSTKPSRTGKDHYRRIAGLVAQAADALEYAHSIGVVHRDVKPANLLLDAGGHLWVTDFGLARLGDGAGLTASGDLLGTLRYMSPEQALAKHGLVDHRTDVYALGATLYELLTLRPAVCGDDKQEVLLRLAFEEPTAPRKLDKAIPAELETITLKALTKNPNERYAAASELADDLRRWLGDQPIRAHRPTVRQRLVRWGRRHPGITAALGLAAGLLLAGAWAWDRQTTQAETAARAVAAEADQLRDVDRLPEAFQAARRAADLLPRIGGDAKLRCEIEQRVADLQLLNRLEEARLDGAAVHRDGKRFDDEVIASRFKQALQEYGVDVIDGQEQAVVESLRRSAITARAVTAIVEWERDAADPAVKKRLSRLAEALDPDPRQFVSRMHRAEATKDGDALKRLAVEAQADLPPPAVLVRLGRALWDAKYFTDAERLLRAGQQHHPADFWLNHWLAEVLRGMGPPQRAEAVRFFTAAVVLRPKSPGAWLNLGHALHSSERNHEAEIAYRRAIELKPDYAGAFCNLGATLRALGRPAEAEAALRRAIELKPSFDTAHFNLGLVLDDLGRLAEAEAAVGQAVMFDPDMADAHGLRAQLLGKQGRHAEAEAACRRALKLNPDLADAYGCLGNALQHQGRIAEAEVAYRRAIELNPNYAEAYSDLGRLLTEQARATEAVAACRRAIELNPHLAEAYGKLGDALTSQGQRAEAEAAYRQVIKLKPGNAEACYNLGNVLRDLRRRDEAIEMYRQAIALRPDIPEAHCNLGLELQRQGHFSEAAAELRTGHELGSKRKEWPYSSAEWLREAEQWVAAEAKLPSALAGTIPPGDAGEWLTLAKLCHHHKKRYADAARFYACAFAAEPKLAEEHNGHRYNAACAAAVGACSDVGLDDAQRARLRRQALDWLAADLAAWAELADNPADRPKVRQAMQHWQKDSDFAGVRGDAALARLPEAERDAWQKLWAEVADLLKRTDEPTAAAKPTTP
jgi:serine/threonine protein kinase/Flp pilus assembly protein TadD